MENSFSSTFYRDRHVRYWLRCLKTYLPSVYTSGESQRMLLACFVLSALDLLDALHTNTTADERASFADWLYHCQHPNGGFRGFTGNIVKDDWKRTRRDGTSVDKDWDPANIAGTFFALAALGVLGDDLKRVRRRECLKWLKKLQWEDGSFAEVLGEGGRREGGQDGRLAFLALLTRRILKYGESGSEEEEDIDTESVARFILQTKTYEGGFAQSPLNEAQGGSTYCGVGALALLGKWPISSQGSFTSHDKANTEGKLGTEVLWDTVRYLIYRQVRFEDQEDDGDEMLHAQALGRPTQETMLTSVPMSTPESSPPSPSTAAGPEAPLAQRICVGLNGRCNKAADTCYSWWVGGSLSMLNKLHLLDVQASREFLLAKTQHIIGGFAKVPGEPPDILHSYLGLAALSLMKEPGLKTVDPVMCISLGARENLDQVFFAADTESAEEACFEL